MINQKELQGKWSEDRVLKELPHDESAFSDLSRYFIQYGVIDKIHLAPIDLGDFETATMKSICSDLEVILAEDRDSKFESSLKHFPKHWLMRVSKSEAYAKLRKTDTFRVYAEHLRRVFTLLKDEVSVESAYLGLGLGLSEEAVKARQGFELRRQQMEDKRQAGEGCEEFYADTAEITSARSILREYIELFKQDLGYSFNLGAYLSDQRKQWAALSGESK